MNKGSANESANMIARDDEVAFYWPNYLAKGYFERGALHEDLVRKESHRKLVVALNNASPPLSMKQLRQFFAHARRLEVKLRSDVDSTLADYQSDFYQMQKIASYRLKQGGSSASIPFLFRNFIDLNTAAIAASKDPRQAYLNGFIPHFEALVAYFALVN